MNDLGEFSRFIPVMAVALDLLLGDPQWVPHPVRAIGSLAEGLEALAHCAYDAPGKAVGALCALALTTMIGVGVLAFSSMGPAGFFVTLYLSYAGLALRCLLAEAVKVHRLLLGGHLTEARVALSMLVSRDTEEMSEAEVRRSLAETVSENLCDGFAAPLFWLCVAGPVGMWVYKTISTLDSMWGYKTEKYRNFGWFSAKADDALAYVPARLTALAMLVAGAVMRLNLRQTLKHFMKDARQMESPNAGWPMAAAAWLIGARMGGPTRYFGKVKQKPVLGPDALWTSNALSSLTWLCLLTAVFLSLAGQGLFLLTM